MYLIYMNDSLVLILCFKSIQFLNQYEITENIVSLFINLSLVWMILFNNGVYLYIYIKYLKSIMNIVVMHIY